MAAFKLERDSRGHLVLIDEHDVRYPDAAPVRAFPLSDPPARDLNLRQGRPGGRLHRLTG